jgi:hypothetical protein
LYTSILIYNNANYSSQLANDFTICPYTSHWRALTYKWIEDNIFEDMFKLPGKNLIWIIVFFVCVLIAILFLFTELPTEPSIELSPEKIEEWTIGIYMCGTDLESEKGQATHNIMQMLEAEIPESVTILLLTGGTRTWNPNGLSSDGYIEPSSEVTQLWKVDNEGMHLIKDIGKQLNMGDTETLVYLLETMITEYPAKRFMLEIWDHGSGPLGGVAYDDYTFDALYPLDLTSAFKQVFEKMGSNKIDLLGFDACLMSNMEMAMLLSPYANYMVASAETAPGKGWNYTYWLNELNKANGNMEADMLGRHIIDGYAYYESNDGDWTQAKALTLALVDLTKMDQLIVAFNEMAFELATKVLSNNELYAEVIRQAQKVDKMSDGLVGLLDLYDFANSMTPYLESATDVMAAVGKPPGTTPEYFLGEVNEGAVIYRGTGNSHNKGVGLTFFYPTSRTPIIMVAPLMYRSLGISDTFSVYLYNTLIAVDKLLEFKGEMKIEQGNTSYNYQLVLDDTIAAKSVEYIITRNVSDDESSVIYYLGSDTGDWDWDNGVFTDNYDGIKWYSIDGEICTMDNPEGPRNGVGTLKIPVIVNDEDFFSTMTVWFDYDEETSKFLSRVSILSIQPHKTDGTYSRTYKPDKGTKIYTILYEFDPETGKPILDTYKKSNKPILFIGETEDGYFNINFSKRYLKGAMGGQNVCYFKLTDMRDNVFFSEPLDCSARFQGITDVSQ